QKKGQKIGYAAFVSPCPICIGCGYGSCCRPELVEGVTETGFVRRNSRLVSEDSLMASPWVTPCTPVPAAAPAPAPIAAPLPPPANPPINAPNPAPPAMVPAVRLPRPAPCFCHWLVVIS